jgi:hypothetical protein
MSSRNMRLLLWAALRSYSEQFIYNWMLKTIWTRNRTTDRNSTDSRVLIKLHLPLYLTPRTSPSGGQPPPPPPPHATPHPISTSTHAQDPNGQLTHLGGVTFGAMCNQGVIQCAAAMRVTCLANTGSSAKANLAIHQMTFDPPADSPRTPPL